MDDAEHMLRIVRATLEGQKELAEKAMAQLDDDDLHWTPDPESNSVAIIVKHLAGNMRSRWTDFLTTDGEKANRNRDGEFVDDLGSRERLMAEWELGWGRLFDTLATLRAEHLQRLVAVRGKEQTVSEAVVGQLGHYAQHVGQIIYIAKLRLGERWETLSIPRKRPAGQ